MFRERVTQLGATVKESPGPRGNRLAITFPGHGRTWTLEPQVLLGSSKPDFVLTSSQGGLPPVAIFTDGRTYHATQASQQDRRRRRQTAGPVRCRGDRARHHRPGRSGSTGGYTTAAALAPRGHHRRTDAGIPWVQPRPCRRDPPRPVPVPSHLAAESRCRRRFPRIARQVPLLFAADGAHFNLPGDADLATVRGAAKGRSRPVPGMRRSRRWWWSAGPVGCLAGIRAAWSRSRWCSTTATTRWLNPGHADAWREWLRISNALNLRQQPTWITALSAVIADGHRRQPAVAPAGGPRRPADLARLSRPTGPTCGSGPFPGPSGVPG